MRNSSLALRLRQRNLELIHNLTLVKVWENRLVTRKSCEKNSPAAPVPAAFLVLPNFHSCFYLTIRPVAEKGYESIAHEAKPNGL